MKAITALISASLIATLGIAVPAYAGSAAPAKNIVLVHGSFADGSGWKSVADILQKDGFNVSIVQEPETSLEDDVAATNRIIDRLNGPAVLVGHSYGGAVITEAGNNAKVQSLVYVAAFQPDTGENVLSMIKSNPGASTGVAPSADGYLFMDPKLFASDFAADLPKAQANFMAISQMPTSIKAFTTDIQSPAWKTKPSFAIVATQDRIINPELERSMYKRSNSVVTEVKASHSVFISQPKAVAAVIEKAAKAS